MYAQKTTPRPAIVTQTHLAFLDTLRKSGDANMYGASADLMAEFDMDRKDAKIILKYWMATFIDQQT